jgi:hypothetical protein
MGLLNYQTEYSEVPRPDQIRSDLNRPNEDRNEKSTLNASMRSILLIVGWSIDDFLLSGIKLEGEGRS